MDHCHECLFHRHCLVVQTFKTEGTVDDYLGQKSWPIEFSRTMQPKVLNTRILLKVDAEMLAAESFLVNTISFYTVP